MKKFLLSLCVLTINTFFAQNLLTENFDILPASWTKLNLSSPVGTAVGNAWSQGDASSNTYINVPAGGGGSNGGATSYAYVNFNSTTGANTISNWFITPVVSLINGDVISFYTIKGLSGGGTVYADNMQVRLSTTGAASTNPTGNTGVGSFTTIISEINPTLSTTGYPTVWTQYSYTVVGLPVATDCKVAFRYFVPNGGPTGANSDYIGLDRYSIDRTLSNDTFFKSNFSIAPNPANDFVTISKNSAVDITSVTVTDINGRIVKEINNDATTINVSDLNAGVYFLKINTAEGSGTTKLIKN